MVAPAVAPRVVAGSVVSGSIVAAPVGAVPVEAGSVVTRSPGGLAGGFTGGASEGLTASGRESVELFTSVGESSASGEPGLHLLGRVVTARLPVVVLARRA